MIHVPPAQHPSLADEKARYDLHRNFPDDPGYRAFLSQLTRAIETDVPGVGEGLDVGCGPTDLLAMILRENGWRMRIHDPFYHPDPDALTRGYDLVTCTEVVEHFRDPAMEWTRLVRLVRPGGWLGIMTALWSHRTDFKAWRYRRDETHLCFYSTQTLNWLATRHGLTLVRCASPVALFQRQNSSASPNKTTG